MKLSKYRPEVKTYLKTVQKALKAKYGSIDKLWDMPLTLLAENLEVFYQASEKVRAEGITLSGARGLMIHPAQSVVSSTQIRIEKMIAEFGLSPKSAAKLDNPNSPDEPSASDFIDLLTNG